MKTNPKKVTVDQQAIIQLTADLQRMRADFENYRKRVDTEKTIAKEAGRVSALAGILDIIDTIDRAVSHIPVELQDNPWAQGVAGLDRLLDKNLADLGIKKIVATPGTKFDPHFHEAVQFDEDSVGNSEVVAEELRPGYLLDEKPFRPAMVKVKRQEKGEKK